MQWIFYYNLKELKIIGRDITDLGLYHLTNVPTLAHLQLSSSNITDNGLRYLGELTNLESLNMVTLSNNAAWELQTSITLRTFNI